jgi:hypothetical protein
MIRHPANSGAIITRFGVLDKAEPSLFQGNRVKNHVTNAL